MGNRIGAATSALLPHPTRWNTPPLSKFLGSQNLKERALAGCVLCSGLCSSGFHAFSINTFVWRFAEPPYFRGVPLISSQNHS